MQGVPQGVFQLAVDAQGHGHADECNLVALRLLPRAVFQQPIGHEHQQTQAAQHTQLGLDLHKQVVAVVSRIFNGR